MTYVGGGIPERPRPTILHAALQEGEGARLVFAGVVAQSLAAHVALHTSGLWPSAVGKVGGHRLRHAMCCTFCASYGRLCFVRLPVCIGKSSRKHLGRSGDHIGRPVTLQRTLGK